MAWGRARRGAQRERGKRAAQGEGKKGRVRLGTRRAERGSARGRGVRDRGSRRIGGRAGPGRGSHFLAPLALAVQLPLQALRAVLRLVRLLLQRLDLAFHRLQGVEAGHGAGAHAAGAGMGWTRLG